MGHILLPGDPDYNTPVKMGDPYSNPESMPPKLAAQHRAKIMDEERAKNSSSDFKYANSAVAHAPDPWYKNAQMNGVSNMMTQPMWFSPLHTPQNWQIASRRREIYQWCRFFHENEPKVAASIDFYSRFPMNGFELECHDRKVRNFFAHKVVNRLDLNEQFKMISSEYFLLGDVFVHAEVECPVCNGSAIDPETGETCSHPGGTFRRIIILNPDWIEVQQSVLVDDPSIVLIPDEELKRIVFTHQPKSIYDKLPDSIKLLVMQNKPIPLSSRVVSHIKHMPVPYGIYGTSLIRRLFTTLAYKTKLMTANWIVAERLILPVRVVQIGSDQHPATTTDIADVQQQLAATANDPNLTIVTHHNFKYEWFGSSGKILQVTQEFDHIDKEILDGMMLNQALLNGEMGSYGSAQVGVETLIRRLESWRSSLAHWAEERIFKPIAEMQGFIDEKASQELGETVYLYPRIKWNDLQLKDKSQWHQTLMALYGMQVISQQTLTEELGLDYNQEVERIRYEQIQAGGAIGGGGGGGGGGGTGMPAGGGVGGGMAGAGGDAGMGLGDMGGGQAGPGGMAGPGDMAGAGAGSPSGDAGMGAMAGGEKVMKKGKGSSKEEKLAPAPMIKLTGIEQKMRKMLLDLSSTLNIDGNNIKAQYPVNVQTNNRGPRYSLDFAIPNIKLGIECDGSIWHSSPEQKQDDSQRDFKLAQHGWTILRFDDVAIEDSPQAVQKTISAYIQRLFSAKTNKAKTASAQECGSSILFVGQELSEYIIVDNTLA